MTSAEGSGSSTSAGRRPLGTPEEIWKAFTVPPSGGDAGELALLRTRPVPGASPTSGVMELLLALTGVGLSAFMVTHLGLLFTVLIGASTMDALATFLERYFLLQSVAPFLIIGIVAHAVLSLRRVPGSLRQHGLLASRTRAMRHFDTFLWSVQMVTGLAIGVLVSIHLWVLLTDLPIEAAKSGARVQGIYLWLYIPFLLAVEGHISAGVYRIAVKWGINRRSLLHTLLTLWTVLVLALGAAILVAFYRLGGSP